MLGRNRQSFRRDERVIVAREDSMSVVLVTGSSSGIGLATALHFAREGWDVHAGVRNPATAAELQQAIVAENLPITPVPIDVDDAGSVTRGVSEVLARAGQIDALVNNAGIGGGGAIEDVPVEWAKSLFETNYFGAIRMTQAVLPGMRERRGGAIINVSSIAGRLAIAGHGHYSAVKHAVEAISEVLAQEVQAFGIRVAVVEPGVVVTPIFTKAKRFSDPASPYAVHVHRLLLFYQMQMTVASQPADVARVIFDAVTTKEPRLRYLVGDDAEKLVAGRRKLTDEEYVDTGRPMPDEEYLDLMRRRYGFSW
jgi:NAD(P)-dependent dehydrogenase (short-subunit alcohol dehydrogenase family)